MQSPVFQTLTTPSGLTYSSARPFIRIASCCRRWRWNPGETFKAHSSFLFPQEKLSTLFSELSHKILYAHLVFLTTCTDCICLEILKGADYGLCILAPLPLHRSTCSVTARWSLSNSLWHFRNFYRDSQIIWRLDWFWFLWGFFLNMRLCLCLFILEYF